MCPSWHECSHIVSKEEKNKVYPCPSSTMTSVQSTTISTMPEVSEKLFVYSRKKLQRNSRTSAIFSAQAPESTKRSGEDCASVVSYCAPSAKGQHVVSQCERAVDDKGEIHVLKSESINGCLLAEERSDEASKNTGQKVIEVDSINDSCSSSKLDMELVSACTNTEVEDTSECSSSGAMVVDVLGEESSEKDIRASTTRSQGVLDGFRNSNTHGSLEGVGDSSTSRSWFCKICSHHESPLKMLICDNCEEAFHLSCCIPRVKKIPEDEWFCHSCSKKRRKILTETISKRYSNMIGEKGRCINSSTSESNPIALMLRATESYSTGVRIGKGFQAEVPDWTGPITDDADRMGEALELDPSEELESHKPHSSTFIGNWLQCREIIDGAGESANGTICGKWRRAPLFEVQSEYWGCFCSVLWNPIHADCAVPQELDTDQVLKQLKYIRTLRQSLTAKRRKLECLKNEDDSVDYADSMRNTRTQK